MTMPAGTTWRADADVVVVGAGVAGLAAALAVHRRGRKVVVLSKVGATATHFAQGGSPWCFRIRRIPSRRMFWTR